jgi:hypothetical protein
MTEQEIQAAIEKASAGYKANIEREIARFKEGVEAKLAGHGEFSIDTIEEIWGDILDSNKKVTEVLINEVSNGITEKELIAKKKAQMKEDGVEVENNGKQERSIQTMHGIITPNRTVLKPSKKRCSNQWCSLIRSGV